MATLHFFYSLGEYSLDGNEPAAAPYSIAWNIGRALRALAHEHGTAFNFRNLDDAVTPQRPLAIAPDDIVIGHPWWGVDNAPMNYALRQPARYKAILTPFTPHVTDEPAALNVVYDLADHLFLICGEYWWDATFNHVANRFPHYAHHIHKATRLDMAISPHLHPFSKVSWGRAGFRRAAAIGNDLPYKGNDLVARLAAQTNTTLGYFGSLSRTPSILREVPHAEYHGMVHFDNAAITYIASRYDFMWAMGRYDANPTTLLEAAAWGLLVFCTPQSGYYPNRPFVGLLLDDLAYNIRLVDRWQYASEGALHRAQAAQREAVTDYTWQRFFAPLAARIKPHLMH